MLLKHGSCLATHPQTHHFAELTATHPHLLSSHRFGGIITSIHSHEPTLPQIRHLFRAPSRLLVLLLFRLRRPLEQDLIHNAHLLRLMRHQIPIPLHHVIDSLCVVLLKAKRLVEVPAHNIIDLGSDPLDLGGINDDVGGLALCAAQGLVHHDGAVRQGVALAGLAAQQQDGGHGGGGADADGRHGRLDVGHGVVDGQPGADLAARGVDVHGDGLLGGVGLEP